MALLKALGLILLILVPVAAGILSGHAEYARYVAIGCLLSLKLVLLARPVAAFSFLIPVLYGAAALTAQSTDGVAALVVAVAAGAGAGSSQGLHRGLLALLAAVLIGSFDPANAEEVLLRSIGVAVGSLYGYLLGVTVLRKVSVAVPAVEGQTALSYAVLLAVLVLIAWILARAVGFEHGWWLPLAVMAVSQPSLEGSLKGALGRLIAVFLGTIVLIAFSESLADPVWNLALAGGLLLLILTLGRTHPLLRAVLTAPIIVLFAGQGDVGVPGREYLVETLLATVLVVGATVLGEWVLWTLRPDRGRVSAA